MNAKAMLLGAVLLAPLTAAPAGGQDRAVPAPSSAFADAPRVRLWLNDDRPYQFGEAIRVFFRTEGDAFVTVVALDASGRLQILFPRSPRDNAAVLGGTTYYIDSRSTNIFSTSTSAGVGYVFAIASAEPLDLTRYTQRNAWRFTQVSTLRYESTPDRAIAQFASDILFDDQTEYSYDLAYVYVRSSHLYSSRFCYADAFSCRDFWNSGYSSYSNRYCYTAFSFYTSLFNDCFLYGAYYRPYVPRPTLPNPPSQPPTTPRRTLITAGGWRNADTVSITMPEPTGKPATVEPGDPLTTDPQRAFESTRQRRAARADQAARRPGIGEPLIPVDNGTPVTQPPRSTLRENAVRQPMIEPRVPGSYDTPARRPVIEGARRPPEDINRVTPPMSAPRDDALTRHTDRPMRPNAPRASDGGGSSASPQPIRTNDGGGQGSGIDRSTPRASAPAPAPTPPPTPARDPSPAPMIDRSAAVPVKPAQPDPKP